jgi:WD40 repeat protein
MSSPRRGGAALLTLGAALLVVTGCASIPSSSRPQVIAESVPTSSPAEQDDLRYDEIVPRPGEAPEDIVRDFLRASGSFDRNHARARAYLTAGANTSWKDGNGAAILEDAPYLDPRNNGAVVQMTAQQQGSLRDDGSYVPGPAPYPYLFRLKKVNGNWRIDNPPNGLLIEQATFEAAYHPYEIYFLDSTRTRVVPDIRWYAAASDTLPTLLVTAIERGPSQWLTDGVLSDLNGVTLQNNIEQESDRVKVYLTGLDEQADTLTAGGFAQLVWTLDQVGVGGVEVYSDGQLLTPRNAPSRSLQQLSDWRSFDPDGLTVASTGYFIRNGAVWTTQDKPVAGSAGRSSFEALSVGVSMDQRSLAVVRGSSDGKQVLYVGGLGSLHRTVTGASLTTPTWGLGTREVWTVRDGRDVLLVPLTGTAVPVGVEKFDQIGHIRALTLSRDGSRVAIVGGPDGQEKLWIGVVTRDSGQARIEKLRELTVGDNPVTGVSWSDALGLVALTRSGGQDTSVYAVDAAGATDPRLIPTTGLPGPPSAIAAGPSLPLLTIAADGLWRTPTAEDTWTKVSENRAEESAPVYPG